VGEQRKPTEKMHYAHAEISRLLDDVCRVFTRHEDVRVTLVVRTPWLEDGGVLMGNDEIDEAIKEIERLRSHTPTVEGGGPRG